MNLIMTWILDRIPDFRSCRSGVAAGFQNTRCKLEMNLVSGTIGWPVGEDVDPPVGLTVVPVPAA